MEIISTLCKNVKMIITKYDLNKGKNIKIAFLADLHQRPCEAVIEKLKEMQPDIICVAGDIFERHDFGVDPRNAGMTKGYEKVRYNLWQMRKKIMYGFLGLFEHGKNKSNYENAEKFFEEASKIAPMFYSRGNHEWYLLKYDVDLLKRCGVRFLDNEYVEWNDILICGIPPVWDDKVIDSFSKMEGFKIVLCHHPEFYESKFKDKDIDLVLSGHAHGGQIRLFGHGIWSPGQGLFPKYTKGVFDNKLVVTTGCSNTAGVPRFGNPCEVVEINI